MAAAFNLIAHQSHLSQDFWKRTWSVVYGLEDLSALTILGSSASSPTNRQDGIPRLARSSSDVSFQDSSPELEIMEIRRIAKPLHGSNRMKKSDLEPSNVSPIGDESSNQMSRASSAPLQKRESIDLNLIDPALRTDRLPLTVLNSGAIAAHRTGDKRLAEPHGDEIHKRLKAETSGLITPPSGTIHSSLGKSIGPASAPGPTRPPPQWLANTWSKQDYIHFAKAIETSFNFAAYGNYVRRHPAEIAQVFRGIVLAPICEVVDSRFPTQIKNPGDEAMVKYKANESKLSAILADEDSAKVKALKSRVLAEVGAELRVQIEDEIRTQLKNEGWVQLNKAKDLIAGYEKEINEAKPEIGSDGDGKKKAKVKSLIDAQKDLLAASVAFEKARKAEDRKIKAAEREAKGENGKKLGRPKKGDGKGKGADFV